MNPKKWRVRHKWGGRWEAVDPRHVFLCGPGDSCLVLDTWQDAINYAQKEARR